MLMISSVSGLVEGEEEDRMLMISSVPGLVEGEEKEDRMLMISLCQGWWRGRRRRKRCVAPEATTWFSSPPGRPMTRLPRCVLNSTQKQALQQ